MECKGLPSDPIFYSPLELPGHSKCRLSSLIILGVPKTTHTFSGFARRIRGTQYVIVLTAKVYYSNRIYNKISKDKKTQVGSGGFLPSALFLL